MYRHAARQAAAAAEHLHRCTATDPGDGADAVWAAADTLHAAARATGDPVLRYAADGYDRAARPPHRQVPCRAPSLLNFMIADTPEGTGCGLRRDCSR
ncbi:MAG: hypothetical protein ACRDPY_26465 [Streptosporangiaceae bacterium]